MTLDDETFRGPDPKPAKRVKNPKAMKEKHAAGCFCVLNCGGKGETHHVLFKSAGGDDSYANLVCLCQRHHNLVHNEDAGTLVLLGEHLLLERPDTVDYIKTKLGEEAGTEWLARRLHLGSTPRT
jgi:5-methylcytosine-specific restriction endonuclease McrA